MTQYSAYAGRPPLTLAKSPTGLLSGILLHDAETYISFPSVAEWKTAIQKYITEENYRKFLRRKMQNTVITPEHFKMNLKRILEEGMSDFEISIVPIDVTKMQRWYFNLFSS